MQEIILQHRIQMSIPYNVRPLSDRRAPTLMLMQSVKMRFSHFSIFAKMGMCFDGMA